MSDLLSLDQIAHLLRDLSAKQDEILAQQTEFDQKLDLLLAGDKLDTLTTREVCHVLKISRTKLKGMLASGELHMWKLAGERRITRGRSKEGRRTWPPTRTTSTVSVRARCVSAACSNRRWPGRRPARHSP